MSLGKLERVAELARMRAAYIACDRPGCAIHEQHVEAWEQTEEGKELRALLEGDGAGDVNPQAVKLNVLGAQMHRFLSTHFPEGALPTGFRASVKLAVLDWARQVREVEMELPK